MTDDAILPPRSFQDGFWGAIRRKDYDVLAVWEAASTALAAAFDLTPQESRDFLDSPAGCLLAEDLAFIEEGPSSPHAILALIEARLEHEGWRRWYSCALAAVCKRRLPLTGTGTHSPLEMW